MFQDMGISPATLKAVKNMGFEEATPIQAQTIPISLENKDVIGQAQTGTGKTAAFGIPLVEKIKKETKGYCPLYGSCICSHTAFAHGKHN